MISIDELASFCKKKGFVFKNSEVYNGSSGFFDFGNLGVELKNNIKKEWWKCFVQDRSDMVGIDGSIITHPKVWRASGHMSYFMDALLECKNCKKQFRGDHLIEEELKLVLDGVSLKDIDKLIKRHKIFCPKCKGKLKRARGFNLMFRTNVGPVESGEGVLRPETAQVIFLNFKLVYESSRMRLPFGIAQIGKAFRNEISPRNFLFRMREFEQMEIEYFVKPDKINDCKYIDEVLDLKINLLSADMQKKNKKHEEITIENALKKKIIKTKWMGYWLGKQYKFFLDLGVKKENLRIREHKKEELSHYAASCYDIEYKFPFGWKELEGCADRQQFDLKQHMKFSKKDLSIFDEESKKKVIPYVAAEPSLGVERAFLVFLFDAYKYDKERGNIVLRLHPKLAPIKLGIFPLVCNRKKLMEKAVEVYELLRKEFVCLFDDSGSIGRRYARADEIGIPYCITVDFDSLKQDDVTIRDINDTKQIRIRIKDLKNVIKRLLKGEKLKKFGEFI